MESESESTLSAEIQRICWAIIVVCIVIITVRYCGSTERPRVEDTFNMQDKLCQQLRGRYYETCRFN